MVDVDEALLFLSDDIDDTNMKMSDAFLEGSLSNFLNGIHFVLNYSKMASFKTGDTLVMNSKKDSFSRATS